MKIIGFEPTTQLGTQTYLKVLLPHKNLLFFYMY